MRKRVLFLYSFRVRRNVGSRAYPDPACSHRDDAVNALLESGYAANAAIAEEASSWQAVYAPLVRDALSILKEDGYEARLTFLEDH